MKVTCGDREFETAGVSIKEEAIFAGGERIGSTVTIRLQTSNEETTMGLRDRLRKRAEERMRERYEGAMMDMGLGYLEAHPDASEDQLVQSITTGMEARFGNPALLLLLKPIIMMVVKALLEKWLSGERGPVIPEDDD